MASVIVFGPTGGVGSVVACAAAEHGAKVALAMRDTNKVIPGLTKEKEQGGNFTRIQADLQNPETVGEAVKKSGAKRAFIYLAHGSQDHMKSTIQSLKSAGIEFVVFLSSFTVPRDKPLESVPPQDIIDYLHAQVELNLDEVFGSGNYAALRAGSFATNLFRDKKGILEGDVPIFAGHVPQDWVTANDIGDVGGIILAEGPKGSQRKVYIYGPQVVAHSDAIREIGKAIGKEIKITDLNDDEARKHFTQLGLPPVFGDYFVRRFGELKGQGIIYPAYEEGVENVRSYTGRPNTTFQQWVGANKELFKE